MISDHSTIEQCEVSIVLPVYNEFLILEKNVAQVDQAVRAVTSSYEIVIVEDGSTDDSDRIASSLSQKNSRIIHLHSDTRLGKGGALKSAFKKCRGDVVLFMDIDLATNLRHIDEFIKLIDEGNDAIVGSRARRGAKVHRPLVRKIASHGYNLLVNILFYDRVYDHQCGFKAFRRTVLASVIDEVDDNGFFFDTELLVRVRRKGYRIVECPIEWVEPRVSYVHEDPITLFFKLIVLRFQLL
jgi:glycosyltransferase involved in cell wall biosynthesis